MSYTTIVKHKYSGLYRIRERVTKGGHYIEWPGWFTTPEEAQKEIDLVLNGKGGSQSSRRYHDYISRLSKQKP